MLGWFFWYYLQLQRQYIFVLGFCYFKGLQILDLFVILFFCVVGFVQIFLGQLWVQGFILGQEGQQVSGFLFFQYFLERCWGQDIVGIVEGLSFSCFVVFCFCQGVGLVQREWVCRVQILSCLGLGMCCLGQCLGKLQFFGVFLIQDSISIIFFMLRVLDLVD